MELILRDSPEAYLAKSRYIDWGAPAIRRRAAELREGVGDEVRLADRVFRFVRDEVQHSRDARDRRVTISASDALREGVGLCWTKANLLAALCRASGIPAGICYQRLVLREGPPVRYCVHALNAIYLRGIDRWIRLDARGNKPGVCAEFCLEEEKLAFPVRPERGEIDYSVVYAEPLPELMRILEGSEDMLFVYENLLPEEV